MLRTLRVSSLTVASLALLIVAPFAQAEDDKDPPKPKIQIKRIQIKPGQVQAVQIIQIQGGRFIGGQNDPLRLLRIAKVQDDLKLTEDQKTKVNEAIQSVNAARRELSQGLRGLQGEERTKKQAEMRKKINEKNAEARKTLELTEDQNKRLDQIALQQKGVRAFSDKKVIKALEITAEQQEKMKQVQADGQKKSRQLFQDLRNGTVPRNQFGQKRQEITKEIETDTTDVLDEEQKSKFKKMTGEKLELPTRRLFQALPFQIQPGKIQPKKIQPRKLQLRKVQPQVKKVRVQKT